MKNPHKNAFPLFALLLLALAPMTAAALNDTGQTLCDDGATNMVACTPANSGNAGTRPRQDGRFGRDPAFAAGQLTKTGAGAAGFDFTKVCMNGTLNCPGAASNAAVPLATEWVCTKDNTTNLTWSLQTQSETWANATTTLPVAANAASRCGFTDWRLPTRRELLSIVHNGTSNPSIDSAFFPGTVSGFYWSNDTYVPNPDVAWGVGFLDGFSNAGDKTFNIAVRLVRGAPAAVGFTDNGDGTVTDTVTGLNWDQCSLGQSGATCTGTASTLNWPAALVTAVTANAANYKGRNDWRLPNKNELESIVKIDTSSPAIDTTAFPSTPSQFYWSSTTYTQSPADVWYVGFFDGLTVASGQAVNGAVRLVRGGQLLDPFDALAAPTNLEVSDASLDFGSQTVGVTSAPLTTVLTNSGGNVLSYGAFALGGANAGDFALVAGPAPVCAAGGGVLAAGASCTLSATFTPTAIGNRFASVAVTTSVNDVLIALSGLGVAPVPPPPDPAPPPPPPSVALSASPFNATGGLVNPLTVKYTLVGCYGREMFLVLNAPAMGRPWSYLNAAGQWIPLPANLAQIGPFSISGPFDGQYTLFQGSVPPGVYELYLGCDFVANGRLDIDLALRINGVYDYLFVTVQ